MLNYILKPVKHQSFYKKYASKKFLKVCNVSVFDSVHVVIIETFRRASSLENGHSSGGKRTRRSHSLTSSLLSSALSTSSMHARPKRPLQLRRKPKSRLSRRTHWRQPIRWWHITSTIIITTVDVDEGIVHCSLCFTCSAPPRCTYIVATPSHPHHLPSISAQRNRHRPHLGLFISFYSPRTPDRTH